jgi:hypothetical protein
MTLKIPHCPRCSGACQLKILASVSGADGPLKLTALGLPVFACAKSHHVPVHGDFMLWLIREIKGRGESLPVGKEQGMIFKKHFCAACGKELAGKSERRKAFPLEMKFEELAPFKVELDVPVYKCTGCGKEQIRSAKDLGGHVANAAVGINDAAGFPHSG